MLFISPGDVGKNQVLAKISSMAQPAREADTIVLAHVVCRTPQARQGEFDS